MRSTAAGALRLAAARGDIYTMELLRRAHDFDINAAMTGFTPLMAAVVQSQELAVLWLLQHGASLGARKEDGWNDSVLHYAAAKGSLPIAQALLAFGADASAANSHGRTPAEAALASGHRAVSEYIAVVASGRAAPDKDALMASRRFSSWQVRPALGPAATSAGKLATIGTIDRTSSNLKVEMGPNEQSQPGSHLDEREVGGTAGRLAAVHCCCVAACY
jgi:ankyrin repeat protein